jgi:hypothetical protein
VASYVSGNHFTNGPFYAANVSILESNYVFPTGMKIRFMCDASDNNDDVYVDNVIISASLQASPNNYIIPLTAPEQADEVEATDELAVYPNPASDLLHVSLANEQEADLFVYDVNGKVVHKASITGGQAEIDLARFSNGVYVVYVITKKGTLTQNFVKR